MATAPVHVDGAGAVFCGRQLFVRKEKHQNFKLFAAMSTAFGAALWAILKHVKAIFFITDSKSKSFEKRLSATCFLKQKLLTLAGEIGVWKTFALLKNRCHTSWPTPKIAGRLNLNLT